MPNSLSTSSPLERLRITALTYPAIDNHAHPLLKPECRAHPAFPFEGVISEAQGTALTVDALSSIPCMRGTKQLASLYGLPPESPWLNVKEKRESIDYIDLCHRAFKDLNIHTILLDDGLGGVSEYAESIYWHDQFVKAPCVRIARIETEAETILANIFERTTSSPSWQDIQEEFVLELCSVLQSLAAQDTVVGFKSIACYRTGLNIEVAERDIKPSLCELHETYKGSRKVRLASKPLNDLVVRTALAIAGKHGKPVQFHTGLGDNDINLLSASPAHLQQLICAYPDTNFVLLHTSYPYVREASYLTSVYKNVFLDFGEIFPLLSGHGQKAVLRQIFELCPTRKMLWSTDGHWWPESFYLSTIQSRAALYEVLAEYVRAEELSEEQAIEIVQNSLFHNSNILYGLKLGI